MKPTNLLHLLLLLLLNFLLSEQVLPCLLNLPQERRDQVGSGKWFWRLGSHIKLQYGKFKWNLLHAWFKQHNLFMNSKKCWISLHEVLK